MARSRLTGSAEDERVEYIRGWWIVIEVELDSRLVTVGDHGDPGTGRSVHVQTADRLSRQFQHHPVRFLHASGQIQYEHEVSLNAATCNSFQAVETNEYEYERIP